MTAFTKIGTEIRGDSIVDLCIAAERLGTNHFRVPDLAAVGGFRQYYQRGSNWGTRHPYTATWMPLSELPGGAR